ncbi:MAG TPA: hypothetical protein VEA41_02195 [Salinarimonas sp.]|nr:hypothetical protein [Salinarimonas sp.]
MSLVRDEFYYTVQCHGQTEVVTVRDEGVVIQRALEGAPFLLTKETP